MQILAALALLLLSDPGDVPPGLRCLEAAYPDSVASVTATSLTLVDGTVIPWDDGRTKDPTARLASPDLEDQMATPYPAGKDWTPPPPRDSDPGRVRHDGFFRGVYGADQAAVRSHLVTVRWMPKTLNKKVRVTTVGGVHEEVKAISAELDALPKELRRFVDAPSSFHWRRIKGTDRLSAHSFGIALDVGVKFSNYWRWDKGKAGGEGLEWRNRIPMEIVEIFERHGFIWGGKWYHYDTMHFEYRPELLHPRCVRHH